MIEYDAEKEYDGEVVLYGNGYMYLILPNGKESEGYVADGQEWEWYEDVPGKVEEF